MKKELHLAYMPVLTKLLIVFLLLPFFLFQVFSQTVTEKVSDADRKGIQDISVQVKGTTTGTTTNASGQYSINAASNAVLVFSSVGYTSDEEL